MPEYEPDHAADPSTGEHRGSTERGAADRDPTVGELSEGAILRSILARTPAADAAVVGPGDDAAVLRLGGDLVTTTDTLVHGPDFRLAWSSGYDLGWKSAAVNLADVAAMGARPIALLVALAMPNDTRLSFVEALADGLRDACAALAPGCAVVGGDLTTSATLTVAVTAMGDLDGVRPILRRGARVGDTVAVAGTLGAADRGLRLLFGRFRDDAGTPVAVDDASLTDAERVDLAAQLRPAPPLAAAADAVAAGANAMMDVSDGLLLDARRMSDASGVTIAIDTQLLSDGEAADIDAMLSGGEDHALLATFPDDVPASFRRIGSVVSRAATPVTVDGSAPSGRDGWDPYRDWDAITG